MSICRFIFADKLADSYKELADSRIIDSTGINQYLHRLTAAKGIYSCSGKAKVFLTCQPQLLAFSDIFFIGIFCSMHIAVDNLAVHFQQAVSLCLSQLSVFSYGGKRCLLIVGDCKSFAQVKLIVFRYFASAAAITSRVAATVTRSVAITITRGVIKDTFAATCSTAFTTASIATSSPILRNDAILSTESKVPVE